MRGRQLYATVEYRMDLWRHPTLTVGAQDSRCCTPVSAEFLGFTVVVVVHAPLAGCPEAAALQHAWQRHNCQRGEWAECCAGTCRCGAPSRSRSGTHASIPRQRRRGG